MYSYNLSESEEEDDIDDVGLCSSLHFVDSLRRICVGRSDDAQTG